MGKKPGGRLYTANRWEYGEGTNYSHLKVHSNDEFLYNGKGKKSAFTKEDLPEWFIRGYYFKLNGWLNAKGVKYVAYSPSSPKYNNHALKDDCLYVSYDRPITDKKYDFGYGERTYKEGYYICFGGWEMVKFIKAAEKYSHLDLTDIKEQIADKLTEWAKYYPKDAERQHIDDNFIAHLWD